MLDRFIVGTVTRISPEAPVPVVRYRSEHVRLGGAANVAHNLAALGARVSLVGIVGRDAAADRLRDALTKAGVAADAPGRRSVAPHDREGARRHRAESAGGAHRLRGRRRGERGRRARVARSRSPRRGEPSAILVSDYLKGAVTGAVVRALIEQRTPGTPRRGGSQGAASRVLPRRNDHHAQPSRGGTGDTRRRIRTDERRAGGRAGTPRGRRTARPCSSRAASRACGCRRRRHRRLRAGSGAGGVGRHRRRRHRRGHAGARESPPARRCPKPPLLANLAAGVVVGKFGPATVSPAEILERI